MTEDAEAVRISMWSGPRNISTAMMRSFASRPGCKVVDEPFYAYYLARTGLRHPMFEEVIASQPTDWRLVAENLNAPLLSARLLYIKHMTHHMLEEIDLGVFRNHLNCFLIRDPRRVIASYSAKWDRITTEDIGIRRQLEIFNALTQLTGKTPVVIEAEDILKKPEEMLAKLCAALGIDWCAEMLSWASGRHPEDGVWASHWYASVEASTGFAPFEERKIALADNLEELAVEQQPYYDALRAHKI
ncbi:HAD family hydrolase [Sneathiella chungangensis]|uniref:HAD family hydrolase n=1 Tax=Sneathiella chungangensis TaxID=1418234 RepID=A0A845MJJ9_9PROT|nr:HAD family hydrolase [Sneathiella chungangensis]MZR23134.1 HAD family hydrolase [Sneathiella chungangensis]